MRSFSFQSFDGSSLMPRVTRMIIIVTVVMFFVQWLDSLLTGGRLTEWFSLSITGIKHLALWQPVTYMLLHGGLLHILFNMLGLFFFGPETEREIGSGRFLGVYLMSGIIGGIGWLAMSTGGYCIGASGAVYGILGAFAGLFPQREITLLVFFVIPVTMRARTMAIGLALISLFFTIKQPGDVAYAAHLFGGLAGYFYGQLFHRGGFQGPNLNPIRWINELRWRWHRRKFKVISPSDSRFSHMELDNDVDTILDKISKHGIQSLSQREREILDRASRRR